MSELTMIEAVQIIRKKDFSMSKGPPWIKAHNIISFWN